METAISIAYACKLLRPIDQLLIASCDREVSPDLKSLASMHPKYFKLPCVFGGWVGDG